MHFTGCSIKHACKPNPVEHACTTSQEITLMSPPIGNHTDCIHAVHLGEISSMYQRRCFSQILEISRMGVIIIIYRSFNTCMCVFPVEIYLTIRVSSF